MRITPITAMYNIQRNRTFNGCNRCRNYTKADINKYKGMCRFCGSHIYGPEEIIKTLEKPNQEKK